MWVHFDLETNVGWDLPEMFRGKAGSVDMQPGQ